MGRIRQKRIARKAACSAGCASQACTSVYMLDYNLRSPIHILWRGISLRKLSSAVAASAR